MKAISVQEYLDSHAGEEAYLLGTESGKYTLCIVEKKPIPIENRVRGESEGVFITVPDTIKMQIASPRGS